MRSIILVSLCLAISSAFVTFEDCGSTYELVDVSIEGCNRRLPCLITLGLNTTVNIEFVAKNTPLQLDQDVVINVNFVNLEATVTPDPCDMRSCPVFIERVSTFTSVMSVPRDIALNQRGWLHWRVFNEQNHKVVCFSVLVQTQSSLKKRIRDQLQQLFPSLEFNIEMNEETDINSVPNENHVIDIVNINNSSANVYNIVL